MREELYEETGASGTAAARRSVRGLGKSSWRLMARVPYVEPISQDLASEQVRLLYASILERRAFVLDLYKAIANSPGALRAYLGLSEYVRDESSLRPHVRELAILATAYALGVEYELHHHLPAAREAGVTDTQLSMLPAWRDAPDGVFDEIERSVLDYAQQVGEHLNVDSTCFEALQRHLSAQQVIDLVLTVAFYHLCAAVILPLEIGPESRDTGSSSPR